MVTQPSREGRQRQGIQTHVIRWLPHLVESRAYLGVLLRDMEITHHPLQHQPSGPWKKSSHTRSFSPPRSQALRGRYTSDLLLLLLRMIKQVPSREDKEEQDRTIITHDETRRREEARDRCSGEGVNHNMGVCIHNTRQHWTGDCTQGLPLERVKGREIAIYPQKGTPVVTEMSEWWGPPWPQNILLVSC